MSVRKAVRAALWLALVALALWSGTVERQRAALAASGGATTRSAASRLLGPFASLAASVQWVRVDLALRNGREELAYARAETALELDPRSSRGWVFLTHHFVFDRASLERTRDPATRRRWIEAGLDLLARGERSSAEPSELAFDRGLILVYLASLEAEDRPWPASEDEAWRLAAEAFERAAGLGHPLGTDAAADARANAGH